MSAWPALPPLSVGERAPAFVAATRANPAFHFSTMAGCNVLLAFMPAEAQARDAALAALEPWRALFDDVRLTAFFVTSDAATWAALPDRLPGLRWFHDPDGAVARLYGVVTADGREPFWLLLDPMQRVLGRAPLDAPEPIFRQLQLLPPPGVEAGAELVAPVAIVPRVFENSICERLIAAYDAQGGELSGVMREVGGKTVGVLDPMKRRRDVLIEDPEFRQQLLVRLKRRLIPEIERVFQFRATRLERYLVACYDAAEGGYFRAHRDNETKGTAHRRFAVSINLNADGFEGGDLRFPEFGPRVYRPPTGGAVVFCCSLLHEATSVTRGRRYAFLPFLYDEAGAQIREANLGFLETTPPPPQRAPPDRRS